MVIMFHSFLEAYGGPKTRDFPGGVVLPHFPDLLSVTNLPVVHEFDGLCAFAELRAPAQPVSFTQSPLAA